MPNDCPMHPCSCLRGLTAGLISILLPITASAQGARDCPIQLVDVTAESGITFRHRDGGSGQGYIVEGMTGGMATFDYDNDGWIDIYLLNGAALKGSHIDPPPRAGLYRNNGNWTFSDVTDEAGVGNRRHGMGVTVGDYDNDGDQDMYVTNFGPNVLYRNNGDRTFTDVTSQAGVSGGDKIGAGASFFDKDSDGDLDLYVANYVNFTYENHIPIVIKGRRYQAGPQYYKPIPHTLYQNNGNGTFTDVSQSSGIGAIAGPGMATLAFDYDDDGDTDVFVCNDGQPNFLFQNDGAGKFQDVAVLAGVAYDFFGKANSNMGVDCADYDNDGRLDLFTTGYQSEMPVLYRNLGKGLFEDATSSAKISGELFAHVEWGTGFADFDNDGDQDLFVACGHFDRIEEIDDRTSLKVPNYLMMNLGNGKFQDVSKRAGSGLAVVESSRGAAFDDLDNDGDLDAVVLNSNAPPTILRNESKPIGKWIQIKLQGKKHNFDGVGARVRLFAGGKVQTAEAIAGRSYQGHCGTRLHFGLGEADQVEKVEVRWMGGAVESFLALKPGRTAIIIEGSGKSP
jgi:enediyne biosynthesis protein E4